MNIKVYKIKEGGFNEVRKQMLRRTLPVSIIVLIAFVLMMPAGVFTPCKQTN